MTHTDLGTVVSKAIFDLIKNNVGSLGLRDVLFGNQTMIPLSPTVVVITGPKHRELSGASAPGGRTMNSMTVYIDVHTSKVGDEATERMAVDKLAEAVETLLHADVTLGGILIHGFVNDWDPGETGLISGSQFRTVRMTYIGTTKTYLSQ